MSDLLQRSPIRPFPPFVLLRFSKEVASISQLLLFIHLLLQNLIFPRKLVIT